MHVPVRQEAHALGTIGLRHGRPVNVVLAQQCQEHVVRDLGMVGRTGRRKQVERDTQLLPAFQELTMVSGCHFLGRRFFLAGGNSYGRTVLVAPGNHEGRVSLKPVVASKYVSRQVGACDMAQVERPVCIGPGDADEDVLFQS